MFVSRKLVAAAGFSALLCLCCARAGFAQQVTGTFFPGPQGDIQQGAVPFNYQVPPELPYYLGKAVQLQSQMDLERKPYIAQHTAYASQSLINNRNAQLDTLTTGAEFGFYPNLQTKVQLHYLPTVFGTANLHRPRFFGEEYRATVRGQPTDRLTYYVQAGLFHVKDNRLTNSGVSLIGGTGLTYAINDRLRVTTGYRRDILGATPLSAVGLKLPNGTLVGRDKQNLFFGNIEFRPTNKSTVAFLYGTGYIQGHQVKSNYLQNYSLYASRVLYAREPQSHLSLLLPSYQFLALNYKHDQSGFGNLSFTGYPTQQESIQRYISGLQGHADLPPPQNPYVHIPTVGGYYSPKLFYINQCRLDMAGRVAGNIYWNGGIGLGVQNAKTASGSHLDQSMLTGSANASLVYKLSSHVQVENSWYFLQTTNVYRRQVFYTQTRYYF